jgi:hypothetical protein
MPSTLVERTLQIRPFLCKTNPIFRYFSLKTKISPKNKPNSNPIQTQSKPILTQKSGYQSQTNPILPWNLSFSLPPVYAFLLFCRGSAASSTYSRGIQAHIALEFNLGCAYLFFWRGSGNKANWRKGQK